MINEITDDIYIGDWQDATRHAEKFTDIFTVAFDSHFKGNHFYPLVDGKSSDNKRLLYDAIFDLISTRKKNEGKILVHCVSGISRSVSVVAGYIMTKYDYSVEDALGYIKDIRPLANPVYDLVKLLKEGSQLPRPKGRDLSAMTRTIVD